MFIMYYSPHSHARCLPLRIFGHEDDLGTDAALHARPSREGTAELMTTIQLGQELYDEGTDGGTNEGDDEGGTIGGLKLHWCTVYTFSTSQILTSDSLLVG